MGHLINHENIHPKSDLFFTPVIFLSLNSQMGFFWVTILIWRCELVFGVVYNGCGVAAFYEPFSKNYKQRS